MWPLLLRQIIARVPRTIAFLLIVPVVIKEKKSTRDKEKKEDSERA